MDKPVLEIVELAGVHNSAKKLLKVVLPDLEAQGNLRPSDLIAVQLLIQNVDLMFRLKEQVSKDGVVSQGGSGGVKTSPALAALGSCEQRVISILEKLGASTRSRRSITKPEMTKGEECKLDTLLTPDEAFDAEQY